MIWSLIGTMLSCITSPAPQQESDVAGISTAHGSAGDSKIGSQGVGQAGSQTGSLDAGQTGLGSRQMSSGLWQRERFKSQPPDAGVTVVVTIIKPTIEQ